MGNEDILFACHHCSAPLVVDAAAAGLTLDCENCNQPTAVPVAGAGIATDAIKINELQHQIKENESQRTEITSYINQLSIQLHRWQLRLKSLHERHLKLEDEVRGLVKPS
ncbi:MAG: hypothetical protein M3Z22_03130 [Verrucomicrobiota bacterium]|nr:hypothetical protein [Verrucomicrobiota bacterium]